MKMGRDYIISRFEMCYLWRIWLLLLVLGTPHCIFARNRNCLRGCVFQSFDIRNSRLYFFDDKNCEFRQSFNLPLPNDNYEIVDTLRYFVMGHHVYIGRKGALISNEIHQECCQDFFSLGCSFCEYVRRDGEPLTQFPIANDNYPYSRKLFYSAYWTQWYRMQVGILDFYDVLLINGLQLYLVSGEHGANYAHKGKKPEISLWQCECANLYYPCDDMSYKIDRLYKWFSRNRSQLPTDSTVVGVVNRQYIYASDTLNFLCDTLCSVSENGNKRDCRYVIDGVYLMIYGLDICMPNKADTLVYDNHVLYHACITQLSNTVQKTKNKVLIGPRWPSLVYHPTARMETRAYICENESVEDEQIGNTFQLVYMPLNFHSKVKLIINDDM